MNRYEIRSVLPRAQSPVTRNLASQTATIVPSSASPAIPPSPKVSRFPEISFSLLVLALMAVRILEAHNKFIRLPGSDWSSSDWMIDYAAGFVCRGFGGALLHRLMHATGLGFFPLWITLSAAPFLALSAYLVAVSWRLRGPALWRFALLFNPLFLISYSVSGMFLRKDMLSVLATLLVASTGQRVLRATSASSARLLCALLLIVAAASSLILSLLHEGVFLFIWLPLNGLLVAWILARLHFRRPSIGLLLALTLVPALTAVAAEILHHGDVRSAQIICQSWQPSVPIHCSPGPDFPPAFDALSWPLSRGIATALQYAWILPIAIPLSLLAASVVVLSLRALIPAARLDHLIAALLIPLFASLPLFLVGLDWGRWLCLLAVTALIPMLSGILRPALYESLPPAIRAALSDTVVPPIERFITSLRSRIERHPRLFCTALFALPVPPLPIWWAVFILSPPVVLLRFLFERFTH